MPEAINAHDDILQAAGRLVVEQGVKKLTIDGVAKAAGMSRGGVLYHFPSKDALIEGMVGQLVEQFQAALDRQVANDPEPHGRLTRAYIRLLLGKAEAEAETQETGSVMGALIAGLSYNPRLLKPLHERLGEWQQQTEQEVDPTTAAIVRLCAHALWLNDLLLRNTFSTEQIRTIVARLEAMTRC